MPERLFFDAKTQPSVASTIDVQFTASSLTQHDPLNKYPTKLTSGKTGERQMPWHKLLQQNNYRDYIQGIEYDGYIIQRSRIASMWTRWFKDDVLEKLGIYTKRVTALHSIRNTTIDLWREAGIDQEHRRAFLAHASKDIQTACTEKD